MGGRQRADDGPRRLRSAVRFAVISICAAVAACSSDSVDAKESSGLAESVAGAEARRVEAAPVPRCDIGEPTPLTHPAAREVPGYPWVQLEASEHRAAIEAVLNVHPFHTLHCEAIHQIVPGARMIGTRRHHDEFPDLPWEAGVIEDATTQAEFADDLDFSIPDGADLVTDDPGGQLNAGTAERNAVLLDEDDFARVGFRQDIHFQLRRAQQLGHILG